MQYARHIWSHIDILHPDLVNMPKDYITGKSKSLKQVKLDGVGISVRVKIGGIFKISLLNVKVKTRTT